MKLHILWLRYLAEFIVCMLSIPIGFCHWLVTGNTQNALGFALFWFCSGLCYVFHGIRQDWAGREEPAPDDELF